MFAEESPCALARLMAVCGKQNHMRNVCSATDRGMISELQSLPVIPHQPLGHAAGLPGRAPFDVNQKCGVHKLSRFPHREQTHSGANCRTGAHSPRKAHLVQAVIDGYGDTRAYLECLSQKMTEQRKGQEPVSDAASEG